MRNGNLERRTTEFEGKPNISASGGPVGFGRGGTPKRVSYVIIPQEIEDSQQPNISASGGPVGFGRGGTPRDVSYVVPHKEEGYKRGF